MMMIQGQDNALQKEGGNAPATFCHRLFFGDPTEDLIEHEIHSTVFSPDRTLVAAASSHYIYIWDIEGKNRVSVQSDSDINTITFRPDSQALAFSTSDVLESKWEHKLWLWDLTTKKYSQKLDCFDFVKTLAFSFDGTWLALGFPDGTVQIWETTTYKQSKNLQGHRKPVDAIDFSPAGEKIASGSDDGTIRVWDITSGELLWTVKGHKESIETIAFSPMGKVLASGSDDGTVRVWDITSGELLWRFPGHNESIETITFSATEPVLASGSDSGTVRAWNFESGEKLPTYHMTGAKCRFSSIAVSERTILACAVDDNSETYCHLLVFPIDDPDTSRTDKRKLKPAQQTGKSKRRTGISKRRKPATTRLQPARHQKLVKAFSQMNLQQTGIPEGETAEARLGEEWAKAFS